MIPENPEMLVSFLNLKLRDNYSSVDDLFEDIEEDREKIISKLKDAGYVYNAAVNQFR